MRFLLRDFALQPCNTPHVASTRELPVLCDGNDVVCGSDAIIAHLRKQVRARHLRKRMRAALRRTTPVTTAGISQRARPDGRGFARATTLTIHCRRAKRVMHAPTRRSLRTSSTSLSYVRATGAPCAV